MIQIRRTNYNIILMTLTHKLDSEARRRYWTLLFLNIESVIKYVLLHYNRQAQPTVDYVWIREQQLAILKGMDA